MRLTSGTITSLALTFGALLVLIVVDLSTNNIINSGRRPPKTSFLRPSASSSRRHLSNYSKNTSSSSGSYSSSSNSGSYGGDYSSASSNYMNSKYSNGDGSYGGTNAPSSLSSSSQQQQQYGNNYANYEDNSSYNSNQNYQNQNYDNSNYIWQSDDDDNYKGDDGSYYNQNSNYKADGNYNGRGQSWGGQAVQGYSDDEEPVVYQEGLDEDDKLWKVFGTIAGLSAKETAAVSVLAVVVSLSMIFLMFLACGYNLFDVVGMYCCCGLFGHRNESSGPTETIEDGFVKLGDY
jgi:hypothetical protein